MAKIVTPKVRFRPSTSPDVVLYRFRATGEYTAPHVDVLNPQPDPDGYVRVPVSSIPFLAGVDGIVDVFVTGVDEVGNESDFLRVTGPLDLSAPVAPTDGSIDSSD